MSSLAEVRRETGLRAVLGIDAAGRIANQRALIVGAGWEVVEAAAFLRCNRSACERCGSSCSPSRIAFGPAILRRTSPSERSDEFYRTATPPT